MPLWLELVLLASLAVAVLLLVLAHLHSRRLQRIAAAGQRDTATTVQLSLALARAVLDHETVEKLAAGVQWAPRDDLERLLQAADPELLARTLIAAAARD